MNITKKIKIIYEEAYAESIWCKHLLNGLVKEIKKRRILYEQVTDVHEISRDESVCIIGMNNYWIESVVEKCNAAGCIPLVLSNQSRRTAKGEYHRICPDIAGVAKGLSQALKAAGRNRVALYGANHAADLDRDRTEIFAKLIQDAADIYPNTGNLENCFQSFFPKAALYDAVICVNGYAAISLAKKLEKKNPELLKKLVIVSCEEILRHSKYNQWISLVELNMESYGPAALTALEMASSRSDISSITVKIKGDLCEIRKKDEDDHYSAEEGHQLYEDPEIVSMTKIEQLLRDADDMDHHIIAMLLDNAKYSEIADSCYMTEGNVKYRVKKYMSTCDCKTKKELLELLQEYLQ